MKPLNEILGNLNFAISKPEEIEKIKRSIKINPDNELVAQHNHLIEARYKLTLQEKRVILWLLTQIKPTDEDFKAHRLEIAEFSKIIGLKADNQYSQLQAVTLNLMKRVFKICEPQTKSVLQIAWLSSAYYKLKEGYVLLEFSPKLKPYLLQLKSHFTQLSISDIAQLNSIYSMRIYELSKQYEPLRKRRTVLSDLRGYCGIAPSEYCNYHDFKRYVLERAKKEINEKTDIKIDYQEIKESRKIIAIEWTIQKKDPNKEEKLKLTDQQKEFRCKESLIQAVTKYGFSRTTAKLFLKNYEEEDIKNALRAVDIQIERNHVRNPKAMLKVAIEERWNPDYFLPRKKK